MPRAKKQKNTEADVKALMERLDRYESDAKDEWGGYLNLRPSDADKEAFAEWHSTVEGMFWDDLWDYVSMGCKFTLAWDPKNDAFIATFTGRLCVGDERRWSASARASSAEEAAALLVYKHHVLVKGNWNNLSPTTNDYQKWG